MMAAVSHGGTNTVFVRSFSILGGCKTTQRSVGLPLKCLKDAKMYKTSR